MIKFNSTDISALYIKQLLKDFNLPQCDVYKVGDKVYKNCFYIYNNCLIRALESGIPDGMNSNWFNIVSDNYIFGNKITNITKNLVVNSLNYDSYTHEYLGEYLRFIRDYNGVDLMSMYNCFSNKSITNLTIYDAIHIDKIIKGKTITTIKDFTNDDGSKIYSVKIKPYKKYTIYLDSIEPVEMIACYYDGTDLLDLKFGEAKAISFPYYLTYVNKSNLSFNKPFVYDKMSAENMAGSEWESIKDPVAYNHRKELKLLIKVSAANKSSLVVLEGDYTENSEQHFVNSSLTLKEKIVSIPYNNDGTPVGTTGYDQNDDRVYLNKLGLVSLQTNIHHPFSDRLIEYLFGNVIDPMDTIEQNVARVQKIFLEGINTGRLSPTSEDEVVKLNRVGLNGRWSNSLRNCAYKIALNKNIVNTKYDVIGYIDKDVETIIGLEDEE